MAFKALDVESGLPTIAKKIPQEAGVQRLVSIVSGKGRGVHKPSKFNVCRSSKALKCPEPSEISGRRATENSI